ncbi:hypothetical protein MVEG_12363 [Podila verticillata NRRL 6337]|uniref:Uncharacterized protein n=1 Tax=Podila verticillata NRRL 6337 TaxID=1069443 RepID=A0A086TIK3_9FUNG|nr:hypothetical protein MVEG_12363 [Podila verticillata NRRL 6337]
MVYVMEYRVCGGCDKRKPVVDFYKTIRDVCKICRDEYTRELRQQTKEEEDAINIKRDRDVRRLKKTTMLQANIIERMENEIKSMEKRMVNLEIGLGDLTPPKKKVGLKIMGKK